MTPTIHPLTYHCPHCNAAIEALPTQIDEAVLCPSCQQAFKLELPVARAETSAPAGVILPPGIDSPAETPAAIAPVAAPVPLSAAEQPENAISTVRVSMTRRYPLRCLGYAVAILAGSAGVTWLLVENWPIPAGIVGLILAYLVFRAASFWLRMRSTTLTITDRRCVIETGVFTRETSEFGRKEIVDVRISQDPMMRIFDVGDLVIVCNGGSRKEVVLMAVPHPASVVQMIVVPSPPAAPAAAPVPVAGETNAA